jgi:hypothetical protein
MLAWTRIRPGSQECGGERWKRGAKKGRGRGNILPTINLLLGISPRRRRHLAAPHQFASACKYESRGPGFARTEIGSKALELPPALPRHSVSPIGDWDGENYKDASPTTARQVPCEMWIWPSYCLDMAFGWLIWASLAGKWAEIKNPRNLKNKTK